MRNSKEIRGNVEKFTRKKMLRNSENFEGKISQKLCEKISGNFGKQTKKKKKKRC